MAEETLPGGFMAETVRADGTVRKTPPRDPGFVHGVLAFLEEQRWTGAPRFLGTDERGRVVLEFLEGEVPWGRAPEHVRARPGLAAVARLVRELHDLTAGTALAGDQEVVCHNDLSPKNTVYRNGLPVAFLDWDIATPGRRVHDVAHVCWQFVGLGPDGPEAGQAGRLVRVVADAYETAQGLPGIRADLVETILWWQERCLRGIEAGAGAGDPAMSRLRAAGVVEEVAAAHSWTSRNRLVLERALR